jgi:hypothetical protein
MTDVVRPFTMMIDIALVAARLLATSLLVTPVLADGDRLSRMLVPECRCHRQVADVQVLLFEEAVELQTIVWVSNGVLSTRSPNHASGCALPCPW